MKIYIHIPFCRAKCNYCDFLSFSGHEDLYATYVNSLLKEMDAALRATESIETVYIGGGTPTAMPVYFLTQILEEVYRFPVKENAEITVELNPGTADSVCLKELKNAGVNRLSIGLQSTDNVLLKSIGRIHSFEDFLQVFQTARGIGFTNINVDLMFALPGQTIENLSDSLDKVTALRPEHVSIYGLIVEEGTKFENLTPLDDEADRAMFELIKHKLRESGYIHYEISNFALDGYNSLHNLAYWKREPYIGLGLGAHSFVNGQRYSNTRQIHEYIKAKGNLEKIVCNVETLSKKDEMEEFFFLGLRIRQGVSIKSFLSQFGQEAFRAYEKPISRLVEQNLLVLNGDCLFLTEKGVDLSNYVFVELSI